MKTGAQKPSWVIDKERLKRASAAETVWLFGLHAVRDALLNPVRERLRLVVTKNAFDKLEEAIAHSGMVPEITDPRGAKLKGESATLNAFGSAWGSLELNDTMPLGEYLVTYWSDAKHERHIGNATLFRLEEYKLPEFQVTVKTPIDEKTGKMLNFKNECLILDEVVCQARYAKCRKLCPRAYYLYWREIWVEKVSGAIKPATDKQLEARVRD